MKEPSFVTSTYAADNPFAAVPLAWAAAANNIANLTLILASVLGFVSLIVRFRRARGDERQQLKWFAYFLGTVGGSYIVFLQFIGALYFENHPELVGTPIYDISYAMLIIGTIILFTGIPLIIGLTIFKYRLYDIDVIIRRTVQYAIVSAVLAIVYFGSITLIQGGLTAVTNTQSPLAIVLSTLLIAALFNPLRQRVQTFINRRFYRQKYDAQQVLAQTARDEVELEALQTELVQMIQETMQPEKISLWIKR